MNIDKWIEILIDVCDMVRKKLIGILEWIETSMVEFLFGCVNIN
jgi:hypothetical protein